MRILYVTATYPPSINGVAISLQKTKQEMVKLGHEVMTLAPSHPDQPKDEDDVIRYPSLPNPLVKDYPIPLIPDIKAMIKLLRDQEPDIVHTHHPFHIGNMAYLLAKHYKVPLVFTFHTRYDRYIEISMKFLPKMVRDLAVTNNVDRFCRRADLVISPSAPLQEEIAERAGKVKIVTIPTGVPEIPESSVSNGRFIEKYNLPSDKKLLLTVARISQVKNLQTALEAVEQLDDSVVWIVVGDGAERASLEKEVKDRGISEKVKFMGRIPHDDLGEFYSNADLFVHPSVVETQGLILLEALSFGLPIAAIECSAASEWVPDRVGVRTGNSPEALAEGVNEMLQRLSREEEELRAAATQFAGEFTGEKMAKKLEEEYVKLIESHRHQKDSKKKKSGD